MKSSFDKKIEEIVEFALKNDNVISYSTAVDILKNKEATVEEEQLSETLKMLEDMDIHIGPEHDEGYPAEETDPDTFIPAEVNISQNTINVYNLMERLENGEINLTPSFQRKSNLWSLKQQSQLIESLMLKIPIPAFYFNAADDNCWVVIDGLQRLSAFQNFLVGNREQNGNVEKAKFTGLQFLKDFDGFTFDDLPRQYVRRIKETKIIAFNVEKGTPDEVVFNIFQRINTGGIVLNDQEIRQALYQGKATDLIERLAESEEFKKATQNAIHDDRMTDREYATRFLAFTELDYRKKYEGNIDNFLIKALRLVNTYGDKEISRIEVKFKNIMKYCTKIFDRFAFRKFNEDRRRGPINKALFEMWAVCFCELTTKQLDRIVSDRERFLEQFGILLQNKEFVSALKSGDRYSTVRRIDMARNLVKEFL